MNIKSKFFLQFSTVIYSTFTSIFETSLLYRTFSLEILGTFFLLQSSTTLISSLLNIRIVEITQVFLNKYGLSEKTNFEDLSKLYSFYLITLIPLIPSSFILIYIFKNIAIYSSSNFLLITFFISSTIILNQLTGFWYAYQYYKNKSQNISIYEILKKLFSLIIVFFVYLVNPSKNGILYISIAYFIKALFFSIYEFREIWSLINSRFLYSIQNPILIFKEFTQYKSEVSSSIKTSYLRNLFSSIVKNGDITIAGIIAGPNGSAILKIIKSVPMIILQPSQYINNFSIAYINRSTKSYKNIFNDLINKSFSLLPIALLISIIYYFISSKFLMFVYRVQLSNLEIIIQSSLLFISFFVLIFSWAIPLHIYKNRYKLITINSLIGSLISVINLLIGFLFGIQEFIYISLIFGIFTTFILNTISHLYKIKFHDK